MDVLIETGKLEKLSASGNIDPAVHKLLADGELDAIDELLMAAVEERPCDIHWFLPIFRALAKRREMDRVDAAMELLIDAQKERCDGRTRTLLGAGIMSFRPDSAQARRHLIEGLRAYYNDDEQYEVLVNRFKLTDSRTGLGAFKNAEQWLQFGQGRAVYMQTKGVGRVTDTNRNLGSLKVAFEGDGGATMTFKIDEAQRLLELLPKGHFLLEKIDNPEDLRQLAKEDPGELLRRLFTSLKRSLTTAEIKAMLSGVVETKSWSRWWNKAKNDPRLTVGTGTRPVCTWSDSAEAAEKAIVKEFKAAAPRDRLSLAQKHAKRSSELAALMERQLAESAREIGEQDPALALEMLLARQRLVEDRESNDAQTQLEQLLLREDIVELLCNVEDRASRRQGILLLRDKRQDWAERSLDLLRCTTDNQLIALLYDAALQADESSLMRLVQEILSRPAENPSFYVWLCREMTSREELKERASWTFLQGLFAALGDDNLKAHQNALRKMFDGGGVVDRVVDRLEVSHVEQMIELLNRAPLEDYRKDSLHQDLLKRFPELREQPEGLFYVTAGALERKREEFERLISQEIPAAAEAIKKAKEYGDLRENFEYHAARARQEMLSSRAKTLHDQLTLARAIDPSTVDTGAIAAGTRIILQPQGDADERLELIILGPWDSDPSSNTLSYTAPAAAALLGKKAGEQISFNSREYVIEEIHCWE